MNVDREGKQRPQVDNWGAALCANVSMSSEIRACRDTRGPQRVLRGFLRDVRKNWVSFDYFLLSFSTTLLQQRLTRRLVD